MDFSFAIGDKTYRVSVEFRDGKYIVGIGDERFAVDAHPIGQNCLSLLKEAEASLVYLAGSGGKKYVSINGEEFRLQEVETESRTGVSTGAPVVEGLQVITPVMPGKVVKVQVSEGKLVKKDQTLVIVEAMKMENEMRAPADGKVKKIWVSPGDLVNLGQPMIELEVGS